MAIVWLTSPDLLMSVRPSAQFNQQAMFIRLRCLGAAYLCSNQKLPRPKLAEQLKDISHWYGRPLRQLAIASKPADYDNDGQANFEELSQSPFSGA